LAGLHRQTQLRRLVHYVHPQQIVGLLRVLCLRRDFFQVSLELQISKIKRQQSGSKQRENKQDGGSGRNTPKSGSRSHSWFPLSSDQFRI
jgi:hypothetical protein